MNIQNPKMFGKVVLTFLLSFFILTSLSLGEDLQPASNFSWNKIYYNDDNTSVLSDTDPSIIMDKQVAKKYNLPSKTYTIGTPTINSDDVLFMLIRDENTKKISLLALNSETLEKLDSIDDIGAALKIAVPNYTLYKGNVSPLALSTDNQNLYFSADITMDDFKPEDLAFRVLINIKWDNVTEKLTFTKVSEEMPKTGTKAYDTGKDNVYYKGARGHKLFLDENEQAYFNFFHPAPAVDGNLIFVPFGASYLFAIEDRETEFVLKWNTTLDPDDAGDEIGAFLYLWDYWDENNLTKELRDGYYWGQLNHPALKNGKLYFTTLWPEFDALIYNGWEDWELGKYCFHIVDTSSSSPTISHVELEPDIEYTIEELMHQITNCLEPVVTDDRAYILFKKGGINVVNLDNLSQGVAYKINENYIFKYKPIVKYSSEYGSELLYCLTSDDKLVVYRDTGNSLINIFSQDIPNALNLQLMDQNNTLIVDTKQGSIAYKVTIDPQATPKITLDKLWEADSTPIIDKNGHLYSFTNLWHWNSGYKMHTAGRTTLIKYNDNIKPPAPTITDVYYLPSEDAFTTAPGKKIIDGQTYKSEYYTNANGGMVDVDLEVDNSKNLIGNIEIFAERPSTEGLVKSESKYTISPPSIPIENNTNLTILSFTLSEGINYINAISHNKFWTQEDGGGKSSNAFQYDGVWVDTQLPEKPIICLDQEPYKTDFDGTKIYYVNQSTFTIHYGDWIGPNDFNTDCFADIDKEGWQSGLKTIELWVEGDEERIVKEIQWKDGNHQYTHDFEIFPNQSLTFYAKNIDKAGNSQEGPKITVIYDAESPDIKLTHIKNSDTEIELPSEKIIYLKQSPKYVWEASDNFEIKEIILSRGNLKNLNNPVVEKEETLSTTLSNYQDSISEDGYYATSVTAIDPGANSASDSVSFVFDQTAPQTTIDELDNEGIFTGNTINLSGQISDDKISYKYITSQVNEFTLNYINCYKVELLRNEAEYDTEDISVYDQLPLISQDPTPNEIEFDYSKSGLTDGNYTAQITAYDSSGNAPLSPASIEFTIDNISPVINEFSYLSCTTTGIPTFYYNVKDEVSGLNSITVTISQDGQGVATEALEIAYNTTESGDTITTALEDGQYQAYITATDKAGNSIDSDPIIFSIDTTAPVIEVTSPGNYSKVANIVIEGMVDEQNLELLTINDAPAAISFDADSQKYTFVSDPITLDLGLNTFTISAEDDNPVTPAQSINHEITYDPTPPVIESVMVDDKPIENNSSVPIDSSFCNINVTVDEENLDKIALKLDGEEVDSFYLTNLTNGSHDIEIIAYDLAGWESDLFSFTLNVNTLTAPTNLNISKTNGNDIKLTWVGNGQFNIHRSTNPDQIGSIIATVDTNEYSIPDLPQNTIYYYQVTKTDGEVESDPAPQTVMLCHLFLAGQQITPTNWPGSQTTIGVIGQDIADSFENATDGEIYIDFQHQGQTKQFDLIFMNNQWQKQQTFNSNLTINNSDELIIAVSKNVNWYIIDNL